MLASWVEVLDLVPSPPPRPSSFSGPCGFLYYSVVLARKTTFKITSVLYVYVHYFSYVVLRTVDEDSLIHYTQRDTTCTLTVQSEYHTTPVSTKTNKRHKLPSCCAELYGIALSTYRYKYTDIHAVLSTLTSSMGLYGLNSIVFYSLFYNERWGIYFYAVIITMAIFCVAPFFEYESFPWVILSLSLSCSDMCGASTALVVYL